MRSSFKLALRALAIVAAVAALAGCVYYPGPGYYNAYDGGGYYAPYPYYYGPPVYGGVVIGGGRGYGRWR